MNGARQKALGLRTSGMGARGVLEKVVYTRYETREHVGYEAPDPREHTGQKAREAQGHLKNEAR